MTGLRDSLRRLFSRVKGGPEKETRKLKVAKSSAVAFVEVDLQVASLAWEASEETSPNHPHENDVLREIEKALKSVPKRTASDIEACDNILKVARAGEAAVAKIEPAGRVLDITVEANYSKSNLDAREVQKESIRIGLEVLHRALVQQLPCCDSGHVLRLKLTGFVGQVDEMSRLYFDAYVSSRYIWTPPRWVQGRFIIASGLQNPAMPGCVHLTVDAEERNENLNILLEDTTAPGLPHGVEAASEAAVVQTHAVTKVQLERSSPTTSAAAPTQGLWDLIRQHDSTKDGNSELPINERDLLCLNLALSLLHLSTGGWKKSGWMPGRDAGTGAGIYFLRDPSTQQVVDKTHAYFSCQLRNVYDRPPRNDTNLNCDPQLLQFAKLILEIHLWKHLPLSRQEAALDGEQLRLYLIDLLNDKRYFRKVDAMFKRAVIACLDVAGKEAARDESHQQRLQNYIFDKIVRPLDQYADFPEFCTPTFDATGQEEEEATDWYSFDWRKVPIDNRTTGADALANFDRFSAQHVENLIANESLPKHLSLKIRIAIIDSGLSSEDPILNRAISNGRIRDRRNFTFGSTTDCEDHVGHGTMVARLLMRIAPRAEFYIAKVTDSPKIPRAKQYRIAQAINWAVQKWEVDIINMSLALREAHPEIEEALDRALDPAWIGATRKMVFAAAGSNVGGNERRSWPARKEGVIAVHVTDSMGTRDSINPSTEGEVCFATVGRDVKLKWYPADEAAHDVYVSGTSVATPVAAGIAANVMEIARHRLGCDTALEFLNEERKKRLYSAGCMERIFKEMSSKRDDYYYIQPWTFWEEVYRGRWKNMSLRAGDPENIVKVLSRIIAAY